MTRECLGYDSVWLFFHSEFITGQPREGTVAKLMSFGYSKRQATKTHASYKRRFILLHEHAQGMHKFVPKCNHWVPPVARALAGEKVVIQPTNPRDKASDWVAIV